MISELKVLDERYKGKSLADIQVDDSFISEDDVNSEDEDYLQIQDVKVESQDIGNDNKGEEAVHVQPVK